MSIREDSGRLLVDVAGHSLPLYVSSMNASCGNINGGIAFEFDKEGGWVVSLEDLRELVRRAEEQQARQEQA